MLVGRTPSTFVAIDFEIANESQDSACALGVAVVDSGKITDSFQRLIRPPTSHFSDWNFRVHGIHWADVENEADFATVWSSVLPAFKNASHFVAHNAGFDQQVLAACCDSYGIAAPDRDFVCTIEAASSVWTLDTYKLARVCQFLGIPLAHHSAKSDAEASANILLKALAHGYDPAGAASAGVTLWAAKHLAAEVMQLVSSVMEDGKVEPNEIRAVADWLQRTPEATSVWPGSELACQVESVLRDGSISEAELDGFRDLCAALLGLRERKKSRRPGRKKAGAISVCFTGFGPRKEELRAAAEAAGYHVAASVTKKLDYLVCGPEPGPSKIEQARERGAKILSFEEWRSAFAGAGSKPAGA